MLNPKSIGPWSRCFELAVLASFAALLGSQAASAFQGPLTPVVCHCSGLHDQCDHTLPLALNGGPSFTLELCLDLSPDGHVESAGATDPCSTSNPGDGSEICAWQVEIVPDPGMQLTNHVKPPPPAAPLPELVAGLEPTSLRLNRVTVGIEGEYGVVYLGAVVVTTDQSCVGCILRVTGPPSRVYDAASTLHAIEPSILAVPEPGALALLLPGLGLLGALRARARRITRSTARRATPIGVIAGLCPLALLLADAPAHAQVVDLEGSLTHLDLGFSPSNGNWSHAITRLGDMDGDGVEDFAVGNPDLDPASTGGVRIVFPYHDGTIKRRQLINAANGGFSGPIGAGSLFGNAITSLGDLNGDGVTDIAVAGFGSTDVWILFLNADGTVQSHVGHSVGTLHPATALANLGDFTAGTTTGLAVGTANVSCFGGTALKCGQVTVLFLNGSGGVSLTQTIDAAEVPGLAHETGFGASLAALGDISGDGAPDFAAGIPGVGSPIRGDVAIIRMNDSGTVQGVTKLLDPGIGFPYVVDSDAHFGTSLSILGDVDGNGVMDLAVGAAGLEGSVTMPDAGGLYLVNLHIFAGVPIVLAAEEIRYPIASLSGVFGANGELGQSLGLVDIDSDGRDELWTGATTQIAGNSGILWGLQLTDDDDDGVADYADNCPGVRNSTQTNSDTDEFGDHCDNCPLIGNPTQANGNGNQYGDDCEPPVVRLIAKGDPASPEWDLEVVCNSAYIGRLQIGIVMSNEVDHADVRVGGGCEEPPPGGGGCDAGEPGSLGSVIDPDNSGIFYDPSATNGQRQDTIYALFIGTAYENSELLCEPGITEFIATIDMSPNPLGLGAFPHFSITSNGMDDVGPLGDDIFEGPGGTEIHQMSGEYAGDDPNIELVLELKIVEGQPGEYQICFKAEDHMKRISVGLEPPNLPNQSVPAPIEIMGCTTVANGDIGTFDCDPMILPSITKHPETFTMLPTTAHASGNLLDDGRLYAVFEGDHPIPLQPPALNTTLGTGQNDPSTCVGVVRVYGGSTEPPLFFIDAALDDLPFRSSPPGSFLTNLDGLVVDQFVAAIQFGLEDVDDDSISDETDNCTFTANTNQENTGDLHMPGPINIGLGDACECGSEETVNGHIMPGDNDLAELQKVLVGAVTQDPNAADRCSVDGDGECGLYDALLLDQALSDSTVPLLPSCTAANDI